MEAFLRFPFSFAESEGFKPPIPERVYRISSPARSITLPTLLVVCGCKGTIKNRNSQIISAFFEWKSKKEGKRRKKDADEAEGRQGTTLGMASEVQDIAAGIT